MEAEEDVEPTNKPEEEDNIDNNNEAELEDRGRWIGSRIRIGIRCCTWRVLETETETEPRTELSHSNMEQVMAMIDVEGYEDNRTAPNPKFNEEECYNECNPDCEMTSLIT